ncbi:hypothetical protein BH10PLA2_BH10PLA2_32290 [soil metagenome]
MTEGANAQTYASNPNRQFRRRVLGLNEVHDREVDVSDCWITVKRRLPSARKKPPVCRRLLLVALLSLASAYG